MTAKFYCYHGPGDIREFGITKPRDVLEWSRHHVNLNLHTSEIGEYAIETDFVGIAWATDDTTPLLFLTTVFASGERIMFCQSISESQAMTFHTMAESILRRRYAVVSEADQDPQEPEDESLRCGIPGQVLDLTG